MEDNMSFAPTCGFCGCTLDFDGKCRNRECGSGRIKVCDISKCDAIEALRQDNKNNRQDLIDLLENASHTIDILLNPDDYSELTKNARELAKKEVKKINDALNKWHGKPGP